jgi:hypothetical protein
MTPKQLANALARLFPNVQRAVIAQLIAWQQAAGRAPMQALVDAVERGDAARAADVLLGPPPSSYVSSLNAELPRAALAYEGVASRTAASVMSTTERALIRAVAETVIDGQVMALDLTMPTIRLPDATAPTPARTVLQTAAAVSRDMQRAARAVAYGEGALSYLRSEARVGVRVAVEEGLRAGRNPVDVARGLRDVVGLGKSQAVWVTNLRAELEAGRLSTALRRQLVNGNIARTIEARLRNGKPLTAAEINKIVGTYSDKMRAFHAETVARTMTLDLLRHGQIAGLRAAVADGEYAGLRLLKQWHTTIDGRQRDSHEALDGEEIALDDVWFDDDGTTMTPRDVPGGWQCRCAMSFRAVPNGTTLPAA